MTSKDRSINELGQVKDSVYKTPITNEPLHTIKDAQGENASPILPAHVKNYLIDIDGTVTEDVPNEEPERMATCLPFPDALQTLNGWYDQGHVICFFTSRTEEHRVLQQLGYTSTALNFTLF